VATGSASCLPWQKPPEGQLVYVGPTEQGLEPGDFLPGTDTQFVGLADGEAEFVIEGHRAMKKKGDSLDWDGHPLPGVTLNLNQRIVWFTEEKLHAAGTARVAIDNPQPVELTFPDQLPVLYKLPTTYNVKQGDTIPGTTISYVGSSDKGAELAGVAGYPYRKIADSISWNGQLQEGVFLDVTLRVAFYGEDQLQVAGLATIGLLP
jgi:hypothetical protein